MKIFTHRILQISLLLFSAILLSPVYGLEPTLISNFTDNPIVTQEAVNLNSSAKWLLNNAAAPRALTDSLLSTIVTPPVNSQLVIQSAESIKYLYIQFEVVPAPYSISYNNIQQAAGTHNFLHELIRLDTPAKEVTVSLPNAKIATITIYSAGNLPSSVQVWQTPYTKADMLVLPTHSDDEVLYFGAAIATYVNQRKKIQVAFMVNHNDQPPRPHELLASLWELGITAYPIIGEFSDIASRSLTHAYSVYDETKILRYQVELIRRFRPEVILTHDIKGEYGHGAHMLNTDILRKAIEQSNDQNIFPDLTQKYGTFEPLKTYIHLYEENTIYLDVNQPLATFHNRSAFKVAQDGYAHHVSQHIWSFQISVIGNSDIRKFGLYKTLVGPDTSNNMFQNIPVDITPRMRKVISLFPDYEYLLDSTSVRFVK